MRQRFLAALDAGQRGRASFPFDTDERMNWHFIPRERKGLSIGEMTPYQKHLASALLASGLSQTGYIKAVTIMSLEDVLRIIEKGDAGNRNPDKYYFSVFGTPSDSDAWGYRVEGHHLSQNYTVVKGKVIDGPSFFGANPAQVRQGPRQGLRTLPGEDDLGFELIHALDEPQQKVAIVDPVAYKDILTAASRKAALQGQPSGLSASKMNARQFDALMALLQEYARNVPGELAEGRTSQINKAGRNIYCLVGRHQPRRQALLPRSDALLPHRARQHPGQRQPHPLRVARLHRRLRRRPARPALSRQPPEGMIQPHWSRDLALTQVVVEWHPVFAPPG